MHPHDQSLFVVATVENPDAAALGQTFHAPPQVIVVEVFAGGRLERKHLAALLVYARHDMLDRPVFPRGVHRLKNQQHGPIVLRIEHVL